jgi:hypothetical protein
VCIKEYYLALVLLSDTEGVHYMKCRQNVMLLSLGLHANVLFIWKRFVGPITGLIQTLRQELHNEPYHQINWNKARNTIAKVS